MRKFLGRPPFDEGAKCAYPLQGVWAGDVARDVLVEFWKARLSDDGNSGGRAEGAGKLRSEAEAGSLHAIELKGEVMMLVFSDLHLREETAEVVFKSVLPGILQAAIKRKIMVIACLGDFYHLRYRISVFLQNKVAEWLRETGKRGIHVVLLPGNHDQVDSHGRHALEVFREFPHVHVIDEPKSRDDGLWIPYRQDPEELECAFKIKKHPYQDPVVWMHHGVRGALMNARKKDEDGIDPTFFEKRKVQVFCGHYHKRQKVGVVQYVGSPYQTRADEAGDPKGFMILSKQHGVEFVDTAWGPRFHVFRFEAGKPFLLEGVAPGDEVRAVAGPGVLPEQVGQFLQSQGIQKFVVSAEMEASGSRLQVRPGATILDYAEAYVREFRGQLDASFLMEVLEGFAREI